MCVCPSRECWGKWYRSIPQGIDLSRGAGAWGREWGAWLVRSTLGPSQTFLCGCNRGKLSVTGLWGRGWGGG